MNRAKVGWVAAGLAAVCLAPRVAAGASPEELYEQTYGKESRSVQVAGEPEAVIAFARKLLADGQSAKDNPAFAEFLFEKAYELGSKNVAGYPVAIEGGKAALDRAPERNEWKAKLLALSRLWYENAPAAVLPKAAEELVVQLIRAGDEQGDGGAPDAGEKFFSEAAQVALRNHCPSLDAARDRLEGVAGQKRRVAYEAALKANPKDAAAARGLALYWILETDSPGNASAYLERSGDEQLKTYGPLAAGRIWQLNGSDLMELGDWYLARAADATDRGKARALRKAAILYARYIAFNPQQDDEVLKVSKSAEAVSKAMAAMGNGPPAAGPAGKAPGLGVSFFGEWEIAGKNVRHVCYVVDHSGSVLPAFDEIMAELTDSLGGLHETQGFDILFFAKDTFQEDPARRLMAASDANKRQAMKFLKEIRATGYGSSPVPALAAAFKAFKAVPVKPGDANVLILLTDGDFDPTGYKYKGLAGNESVIAWLRYNNSDRSVHVHPIILGDKPAKETEDFMRKLASENGGKYRHVEPAR
ncbi:MAG: hypothetical protein NTV86_20345 [Planctomycetota bacterium]|nr:hypothetical protein [Planctomycetota bacterium]